MDFTKLTLQEIAEFAVAHQDQMGADDIKAEEVVSAVSEGRAALETRDFGFALIEIKAGLGGNFIPHLWLLYVSEHRRGRRMGHTFMRQLLRKYAEHYHMSLWCDGPRRRAFFGRLGFRIESTMGSMRRMTTGDPWN